LLFLSVTALCDKIGQSFWAECYLKGCPFISSRGKTKAATVTNAWQLFVNRLPAVAFSVSDRAEVVSPKVMGDLVTKHRSLHVSGAEVVAVTLP
jgi:hypothetical protein